MEEHLKHLKIKIKPYLKVIINILKKSYTWKIQLVIAIKFISSKDTEDDYEMLWKSDNIEMMIKGKADELL